MEKRLRLETARLKGSWMQYDQAMLRDYLVEQQEDPRLNLQSILTRHFLIEELFGNRFEGLKTEELRFAAAMNWLRQAARKGLCPEEAQSLLHALSKGADNAAGLEIPHFISRIFAGLPAKADGMRIPDYLSQALREVASETSAPSFAAQMSLFESLWRRLLARKRPARISVLEPACGSANDYRFLEAFGLGRLLNYTGFDLCEKNVRNASALFPNVRFEVGNAFEIHSRNNAFEYCFVHDLFEHLSVEGMQKAIAEICRVTRKAICAHFFNMAEDDEHFVRPVDDYHWNTLSMARTRQVFSRFASSVQVTHIGTLLRWRLHCPETYNEGAYTFVVRM